jgi:hypothetical protein
MESTPSKKRPTLMFSGHYFIPQSLCPDAAQLYRKRVEAFHPEVRSGGNKEHEEGMYAE